MESSNILPCRTVYKLKQQAHYFAESYSLLNMTKRGFYQQYSIDKALDAVDNYEDNHYEEFQYLLFDEFLFNIRGIPFNRIIENNLLTQDNPVYKTTRTHSFFWLYQADRKMIDSKTVYSFRFVNACHPDLYQSFEIKAHPFFLPIQGQRHRFLGMV
jgi:hypothetical protein